ncbi:MAG TPA: glycosyltransferase [Steroidobacteraceae bacterium]|nr:glycosyltransferase [Steroidobacteraceae bacterium]
MTHSMPSQPSVDPQHPRGRMRVGIVLHDLSLGGTERIALRLANQWVQRGAEVTVFCGTRAGLLQALPGRGVRVQEAAPPIKRGPGSRLRLAKAAAQHFHAHPVDVCFVPGNFHWPVAPALAQLAPTRPLLVAQVSAALDKPQRGLLRQNWFEMRMRRLLGAADGIVCMSRRARDQANRILRRDVAIRIPLPALDTDCPAPMPVPSGCRTLLAAGRLVPEKGFHNLIAAFAQLNNPEARLVIVGSGPEEARLRRQISRLGLTGRVSLPGYASDIRSWLDQARAFVLSSRYEGFPAVLIEAFAAGRQVITTRCTHAIQELAIDGDIGSIVPVGDVPAMAAAMRHVLATPPADAAMLAARVANYRIGPLAEEYLRAFEHWIAHSRARDARPRRALTAPAEAPPRLGNAVLDLDAQSAQR